MLTACAPHIFLPAAVSKRVSSSCHNSFLHENLPADLLLMLNCILQNCLQQQFSLLKARLLPFLDQKLIPCEISTQVRAAQLWHSQPNYKHIEAVDCEVSASVVT